MKKTTIIFAMILLLVISIVHAEEAPPMPCSFWGTVMVNGNPAESTDVTAYAEGTTELAGTGISTPPSGNYAIDAEADGKNIFFKINKLFVNEAAVACVGGSITELDLTATDADGDGYNSDDCNETNADINPGATEICNGIDDNCNGETDENLGSTTCGVGACQATVQNCVAGVPQTCTPGIPDTEICGNKIDENCDGVDSSCPRRSTGGGGSCKSDWNCTSWTECADSVQARTCVLNYPTCDPRTAKPNESQSCEMPAPEEIQAPAPTEPELNQIVETPEENPAGNASSNTRRNPLTGLAIGEFFAKGSTLAGIIVMLAIIGLGVLLFLLFKRRKKTGKKHN